MARVLVPGGPTWYDELKAVVYYSEADLEREIKQHAGDLFPGFFVFPFKQSVPHRHTGINRKPDLAMVRKDLLAWGIIEVELGEHDFEHVRDQTHCFVEGNYNAPLVSAYMHKQIATHCNVHDLDKEKLAKLVRDERPVVVVIADQQAEEWKEELAGIGVDFCVFEIFKSVAGQFLYRTFGKYPVVPVQEAHCRRHESLANTMEIVGDFAFPNVDADGNVEIIYDSSVTRWTILEDDDVVYLRFQGKSNPVSQNKTYGLLADGAGRCFMRIN